MKIMRLGINISKMSNQDIVRELLSSPIESRALALANESLKRNNIDAFDIIARNPKYVNEPNISKLILNIVDKNIQNEKCISIIENFLIFFEKEWDTNTVNKILSFALVQPKIAAIILLNEKTPWQLTDAIFSRIPLNISDKTTLENSPHLKAIISELSNGLTWSNERSATLMIVRLFRNARDTFLTEVSKYDLIPDIVSMFILASKTCKIQNKELQQNLDQNQNPGVQIAHLINISDQSSPHAIIPTLINIIQNNNYKKYEKWIWNYLKNKMSNPLWLQGIFSLTFNGQNVILTMIENYTNALSYILDFIKTIPNIEIIKNTTTYTKLIEVGIQNPTYKDKILELPRQYFNLSNLTPSSAKILYDHLNQKIEEYEKYKELMGNTNNWYIKYAIAEEFLKEAGWKENLATSIMAALIMILSGSTIENASQKSKVSIAEISKALKDNEKMNRAKELQKKLQIKQPKIQPKPIPKTMDKNNIDDLVKTIMKHEGLISRQTPFRITNPEMRKWNNIHGFKIDKTTPKPPGRENFIFLVNSDDVPKAIKKQLLNYANNPSRYGLSPSPSIKDALSVFDQSGLKGKIKFVLNNLPHLDINKPLASLFT